VFFDEATAVRGSRRGNSAIISEITDVLSGGKPDTLNPAWLPKHQLQDGVAIRSVVRPVVETADCAIQAAKGRLAGGH
jgi:hypothetical protein